MPGEFDFIQWIRSQQTASDFVIVPPGDDLAVLRWPADELLLVGVDQVLDGVHFDAAVHSPRAIGRKVMNRNLSDCAAMACLPAAAVATVALHRGTGLEYAKELMLGMRDAAAPFDCAVAGGDTASWDGRLVVTVTILGRSAGITPITRAGARAGDQVYVTGPLGGSILGRHMAFEPRVELARQLAKRGAVTAMIDLSDGLSRDLRQICDASGVGAVIEASSVPIHPDARALSQRDGLPPLEHALHDGEDHELLFTSPLRRNDLADLPGLHCIGRVRDGKGLWLGDADQSYQPLEPRMGTSAVRMPTQFSHNVRQTEAIAAALAGELTGGECIALWGDLGAGKTQFVRGLVSALGGHPRSVSSPTFVLLNVYDAGRLTVYHLDAYRVGGAEDFELIGFGELLEQGGVVVVEWAGRVQDLLPHRRIDVRIEPTGGTTRRIEIDRLNGAE